MANEQTRSPGAQGESSNPSASESALARDQVDPIAAAAAMRPKLARSPNETTYSEKQVTEILQRAAQLERGRAQTKPALSLAEVENIAREAGLDPSLVRIAAQSLATTERGRGLGARFIGAPTRRVFERVIEGEISAADHERLSGDLRAIGRAHRHFHPAQVASVGRTLTFNGSIAGGTVELELVPRDGKTLLHIEVNCGQLAGGFFGGLLGGGGTVLAPPLFAFLQQGQMGIPGAVLGALGVWGGVYALARTLFSWRANTAYKRMDELADRLVERVREELSAREQKK